MIPFRGGNFKYPSTFLRTFFEQKRTIEPESFQTVYKLLEKQFSPIRTGRGQVETQKSNCFQNIYNPPQENLQNKKAVTQATETSVERKSHLAHILLGHYVTAFK